MLGWHVGWWGALGLILIFLPYFPRSKHLHLFAAPINFALEPRRQGRRLASGALPPIDFEDESLEQFGAATLDHLRWPQLLDSYALHPVQPLRRRVSRQPDRQGPQPRRPGDQQAL